MNFFNLLANISHTLLPWKKNNARSTSINDLPNEILRDIFTLLCRKDLNSIRSSTRRFHSIVHGKPQIRTKRIIDHIAISRTDIDETRIVTICMEEGKTIVSTYSDYFKTQDAKNCFPFVVKRALRQSTRQFPITDVTQGRKHLENVLATSRQRMESIDKRRYNATLLVNEAMKGLQDAVKGGFVERLTFYELSVDGHLLRSIYNCVRVHTRVNIIEMVNCDISRVTRQHFHDFLMTFSPREISITLSSEQLDLNRLEFWTYSFFKKCIQNGVQKLKLTPHRSVSNPQHINGLNDDNFANLSAFISLEIRQVDVSGLGIRRLIEAYLLLDSPLSIEAFILTTTNFSLDPLFPLFNFHSTQPPPIIPPGTTVPDSTFYFNSPTQILRVKIEYNGRFVSIRSIK